MPSWHGVIGNKGFARVGYIVYPSGQLDLTRHERIAISNVHQYSGFKFPRPHCREVYDAYPLHENAIVIDPSIS